MHYVRNVATSAILTAVLLFGHNAAVAGASDITVQPVSGLRSDFIMGADISMLDQIERAGGKYFDQAGQPKDCLAILKENGVNWIRLRLWHSPVNDADVIDGGRTISRVGEPRGGGNNDLGTTVRLAKRAKAMGFKVLLDLHYSDFWADPEKQDKPAAWRKLKGEALENAVHDYTAGVLGELRKAEAFPDMVQVGNELNGGFLWPDGKTWKSKADEVIGGEDGFVRLLSQGIRAVREADPARDKEEHIKIAVHLANGGTNELYRRVFDLLTARKVDYDVIGLSFYPYWHGSLEDLQTNVDDISSRYGKEVLVMETAYAYTTADGDGFPNLFNSAMQKGTGYKASVQGQASLVRDVINAMAQVPGERGLGLFYWEPDWIPVAKAGWRTGEGNAWDNQAMFDFKGQALPSLAVFKRVRDQAGPENAAKPLPLAPLTLTAFVGETWTPPETIKVAYADDAERPAYIEWDAIPASKLSEPGNFHLHGRTLPGQLLVQAEVEVTPRRNLVEDASFESGKLAGWNITGTTAAVSAERNPGNAHSGNYSMHYWMGEPFKVEFSRTLNNVKDGTYTLKAWAAGGGGENALELYAAACGSAEVLKTKMTNTGWQKWVQYSVKGIKVRQGKCTIGVRVDGATGNWGNVDDFEFIRDEAN